MNENEQFQKLIERAEQLMAASSPSCRSRCRPPRLERVHRLALPQAQFGPRRAGAGEARGHDGARFDLKEIDVQKEKIERNTRSSSKASRPTTCC
jgi:hypothetical protein